MSARNPLPSSDFALRFPGRLSAALAEARGAIAGVSSSAGADAGGLLDHESVRLLHQIFHLRIELELEVAAVLWRTAELVRTMADDPDALSRRTPVTDGAAVLGRRREVAGLRRWPPLTAAADGVAADRADGIGRERVRRAEAA